jgi:hypothetical protein
MRAIVFCVVTIAAVLAGGVVLLQAWMPAIALTAGYAAWLLTRARMIRVIRRLRGDTGWDFSGYYRD